MRTKIIPFDIEMAKNIQDGKIEGKIKTNAGENVRIICWDRKDNYAGPIIALYNSGREEHPLFCDANGKEAYSSHNLVLEVPDNKPQFKPFDKVLVRSNDYSEWETSYFSHIQNYGRIYYVAGNKSWEQCIPYEGHEHLVGTTDKPKEE